MPPSVHELLAKPIPNLEFSDIVSHSRIDDVLAQQDTPDKMKGIVFTQNLENARHRYDKARQDRILEINTLKDALERNLGTSKSRTSAAKCAALQFALDRFEPELRKVAEDGWKACLLHFGMFTSLTSSVAAPASNPPVRRHRGPRSTTVQSHTDDTSPGAALGSARRSKRLSTRKQSETHSASSNSAGTPLASSSSMSTSSSPSASPSSAPSSSHSSNGSSPSRTSCHTPDPLPPRSPSRSSSTHRTFLVPTTSPEVGLVTDVQSPSRHASRLSSSSSSSLFSSSSSSSSSYSSSSFSSSSSSASTSAAGGTEKSSTLHPLSTTLSAVDTAELVSPKRKRGRPSKQELASRKRLEAERARLGLPPIEPPRKATKRKQQAKQTAKEAANAAREQRIHKQADAAVLAEKAVSAPVQSRTDALFLGQESTAQQSPTTGLTSVGHTPGGAVSLSSAAPAASTATGKRRARDIPYDQAASAPLMTSSQHRFSSASRLFSNTIGTGVSRLSLSDAEKLCLDRFIHNEPIHQSQPGIIFSEWMPHKPRELLLDSISRIFGSETPSARLGFAESAESVDCAVFRSTYDDLAPKVGRIKNPDLFLNAGAPIWSAEWCPYPYTMDECSQYLAVGTFAPSEPSERISLSTKVIAPNTIQLWNVGTLVGDDITDPWMEMALVHERGHVYSMSWCRAGYLVPSLDSSVDVVDRSKDLPSSSSRNPSTADDSCFTRRLGLLAVSFSDGSLCVFSIPFPEDVRSHLNVSDLKQPLLIEASPVFSFSMDTGLLWQCAWSVDPECCKLLAGSTHGSTIVWNLHELQSLSEEALAEPNAICPMLYHCNSLSAPVRRLCWFPSQISFFCVVEDTRVLVWDLEHPHGPVNQLSIPSAERVCAMTMFLESVLVGYNSGLIRECTPGSLVDNTMTDHCSTVWSLDVNSKHNRLASASADGTVRLAKLGHSLESRRQIVAEIIGGVTMEMEVDDEPNDVFTEAAENESYVPMFATRCNVASPPSSENCAPGDVCEELWEGFLAPPQAGVHVVRFNPNAGRASQFLVSGTQVGFARLQIIH